MASSRRLFVLAAAGLLLVVLAWTMSPVLRDVHRTIPGLHLGDNAAAVWNTWWFGYAVEHRQPVFDTPMLFAPAGTQLSLHTHATTHSALAWPVGRGGSLIAAHNLAILAGLCLNALCAGLLAWRLTSQALASLGAAAVFSLSAFVQVHALGHINLVHAWVLPLFVLALLRLEGRRRFTAGLGCGIAAALVVYTDYYFTIYAGLFAAAWWIHRSVTIDIRLRKARAPRLRTMLLSLVVLAGGIVAVIAVTGGTSLDLGSARISIRGIRNPLTAFWILLVAWAIVRYPFALTVRRRELETPKSPGVVAVALLTAMALTLPLVLALARVVVGGGYTTQQVLWRSSPPGADLATLLLGSPRHLIAGEWTLSAYSRLGIDMMEQGLWLGLAPLFLIAMRARHLRALPHGPFWLAMGLGFFVLSLGPFLRVAGVDTGLPLPHALLRYAPVFSNARIPGRAVVMVQLAVAVLSAMALATLSGRRKLAIGLTFVLAFELLPARLPAQPVPTPDGIDAALKDGAAAGAVVELPTGLRDGFGEEGQLDHRALVHQVWHERPLSGGFVARLSPIVRRSRLEDPFFANMVALSTPGREDAQLAPDAARRAAESGVAFVVVTRDTFVAGRVPREAMTSAGFTLIAEAGPRELYAAPAFRR